MRDIAGLPAGQAEMHWYTSGVADHMNFRR